jgi:hypothetical protein
MVLLLAAVPGARPASPGEAAAGCGAEPALHALDFWLGEWRVTVDGRPAGEDRVELILGGCAIEETWSDVDGSRGQGVFWYDPSTRTLRQVWLTDQALRPGGQKDKHLVARFADGGTRFQGEIVLPDGARVMDRTTLRPRANGTVSQRIETSRDGGETWTVGFDAVYRHPDPGARAGNGSGRPAPTPR